MSDPPSNPSTSPAVDQSTGPAAGQSTDQVVDQSTNAAGDQSTGPAVDQSTGPAVDQSTSPSADQSTGPAVDQSSDSAVDQSTDPSADQSSNPAVDQSSDAAVSSKPLDRFLGFRITIVAMFVGFLHLYYGVFMISATIVKLYYGSPIYFGLFAILWIPQTTVGIVVMIGVLRKNPRDLVLCLVIKSFEVCFITAIIAVAALVYLVSEPLAMNIARNMFRHPGDRQMRADELSGTIPYFSCFVIMGCVLLSCFPAITIRIIRQCRIYFIQLQTKKNAEDVELAEANTTTENGEAVEQAQANTTTENGEEVQQAQANSTEQNGEEVQQEQANTTTENGEEVQQAQANTTTENGEEVQQAQANTTTENGEEVQQAQANSTEQNGEEVQQAQANTTTENGETAEVTDPAGNQSTAPAGDQSTSPAQDQSSSPAVNQSTGPAVSSKPVDRFGGFHITTVAMLAGFLHLAYGLYTISVTLTELYLGAPTYIAWFGILWILQTIMGIVIVIGVLRKNPNNLLLCLVIKSLEISFFTATIAVAVLAILISKPLAMNIARNLFKHSGDQQNIADELSETISYVSCFVIIGCIILCGSSAITIRVIRQCRMYFIQLQSKKNSEDVELAEVTSTEESSEEVEEAEANSTEENSEEVERAQANSTEENREEVQLPQVTSAKKNGEEIALAQMSSTKDNSEEVELTEVNSTKENREEAELAEVIIQS
ncbi:hypothetical protein QR680_004084 [Steinernema hermaphroditum]|uniref:Uncharacterized protein n=1 Tax=Steinernema hermaphroditum TaxID=289476 RepID=A0AA39LTE9_9BILA|nr:hypothetical protein QR680_004084 [Steinernema hermaphroditum]